MKTKGRPRERGKAEECFREALTLDKNHFLSLLALASLMWHRNYCTQSEILLHTAINLHTEEEWLSWCILSQVYNAQGQTDNEKSCIRKAEVLYTSSHGNRNAYTAPHVLLSPLLKFPFSCGHLFLQENLPSSTVFFETGLFLLDLHLALVCLALDRNEEAEISFQQLQKLELHDVHLLLEVADGFAKCGNYR